MIAIRGYDPQQQKEMTKTQERESKFVSIINNAKIF